jgi:hypothetical protein
MYGYVYSNVMNLAKVDAFASGPSTSGEVVLTLALLVLMVVIQLVVVQWLWNTVLVRVLSVARPLPSLLYSLGLLVLLGLLFPGSM